MLYILFILEVITEVTVVFHLPSAVYLGFVNSVCCCQAQGMGQMCIFLLAGSSKHPDDMVSFALEQNLAKISFLLSFAKYNLFLPFFLQIDDNSFLGCSLSQYRQRLSFCTLLIKKTGTVPGHHGSSFPSSVWLEQQLMVQQVLGYYVFFPTLSRTLKWQGAEYDEIFACISSKKSILSIMLFCLVFVTGTLCKVLTISVMQEVLLYCNRSRRSSLCTQFLSSMASSSMKVSWNQ